MILVTGSYGNGKSEYVRKAFGEIEILNGEVCNFEKVKSCSCIENYHTFVRRLSENGINPVEYTEELISLNKRLIVIIDEIGCGIVPIEKTERKWRENVGKCGSMIAAASDRVIRICCGIPVVIKG